MWETGCKLPTQSQEGRSRCFCGAEIDIASMDRHVTAAHIERNRRCVTSIQLPPIKARSPPSSASMNRYVGNLPPMPGVFPDYPAPVVRNAGAERELVLMRWGMPPPPRTGGPPVTNIRNTSSPHWRGWLKPENRCLVPFNSFAEYAPEPNPETRKKDVVWFATQ